MKVIRWLGIVLGVLVAVVASVAIGARLSDGPIGPFPGGPLVAGAMIDGPVRDWAFVDLVEEIDLQLLDPARSRTTWIITHEGRAYIPCGLPNVRLWKQWPHQAVADGRAMIRVGGNRYRVDLARVEDPELASALSEVLTAKYPVGEVYSGEIWFFQLDPPGTG